MPRHEREMLGPDGLLIILRRAIMLNEEIHAEAIARVIADQKYLHYPGFCDFIGRILLEDKHPEGLGYIAALKREKDNNPLKKSSFTTIGKQTMFVKLAKQAAKLKTNNGAFENAFVAMYENVYENQYLQEYKEYETGAPVITMSVVEPTLKYYVIEEDSNQPLMHALVRNYDTDDIQLNAEEMIGDDIADDKINYPEDHILRNTISSDQPVQPKEFLTVPDENKDVEELKKRLEEWHATGELKYEASLFTKRKRNQDSKAEDLFNYLYPKSTDGTFKDYMLKMLEKDGVTHYVGKRQTKQGRKGVIEQLRRLARYRMTRPSHLTIGSVNYELHYNSFDDESWTVQLVAPKEPDETVQYLHLGKQFKIYYPKDMPHGTLGLSLEDVADMERIRTRSTSNSVVQYWDFDVAQVFYHTEVIDNIQYVYRCEEYMGKMNTFKHTWLDDDNVALAYLQLLVYRYEKGLRTTLTSICKMGSGTDFTLYSVGNTVGKNNTPNRKHPDIWHQLLYYNEGRWTKSKNSYIAKVIDKLQHYLSEKGWKQEKIVRLESGATVVEQVPYPFFKWLETHYDHHIQPGGLWEKMIDSLQNRYDGRKNPTDANITTFDQNNYIKSQNSQIV